MIGDGRSNQKYIGSEDVRTFQSKVDKKERSFYHTKRKWSSTSVFQYDPYRLRLRKADPKLINSDKHLQNSLALQVFSILMVNRVKIWGYCLSNPINNVRIYESGAL